MAPAADEKPLKRTSVPRRKTGCTTCRKRHIRCDEKWGPSCEHCRIARFLCDGRPATTALTVAAPAAQLSIQSYAIPFRVPGSQDERRAFHYFCVQGSDELSGWITSPFWSHTVLQASHTEPVIQKALVALSAAHLEYSTNIQSGGCVRSSKLADSEDTSRHYLRASRALRRYLAEGNEPSRKIVLICCLILFAFEEVRVHHQAALQHLDNGLKIIRSSGGEMAAGDDAKDLDRLARLFSRLEYQAAVCDEGRELGFPLFAASEVGSAGFNTIEEALDALTVINVNAFRFCNDHRVFRMNPEHMSAPIFSNISLGKEELLNRCSGWNDAFEKFKTLNQGGSTRNTASQGQQRLQRAIIILEVNFYTIRGLVLRMVDRPRAYESSCIWKHDTEAILRLTASLEDHRPSVGANIRAGKRYGYTLEMGIVMPLFILGSVTTDASIFQRVTALLSSTPVGHEGRMDAQTALALLTEQMQCRGANGEELYDADSLRISELGL